MPNHHIQQLQQQSQQQQQQQQQQRRGMTPRMLELSRRLSDIEFKEHSAPSAQARPPLTAPLPQSPTIPEEEQLPAQQPVRLRDRLRVPMSEPSNLCGLDLVEPAKVDTLYAEDHETSQYRQRRRARGSIGSLDNSPILHVQWQAERHRLTALTRRIHEDWEEVSCSMRELRGLVAANGGLPVGAGEQASRLRRTMWLAMLEVQDIGLDGYVRALRCCPSASADKIDNDAFRTLAADAEFRRRVSTDSIVRVLNALLSAPDRSASDPPRYVQGMNTLLAPFLFVMGEGAGFYAFRQFLRKECPLYARPSLPGVHACVQLVDECLALIDPQLFSHLKRHGAVAKIYAFPAAMTLCASIGPLRQVVRLWDFLLANGVHLNILCIIAQLLSMRELLVTTRSPMAFLRSWPPLRADSVIRRTRELYELLPERLRRRIKLHAHDPQLAEKIAEAPPIDDPLVLGFQRQQLKRDLPQSPDVAASYRNVSIGRPRARTFSGMAKRLRTAPSVQLQGMMADALDRLPSYGAVGLGLRTPSRVASSNNNNGARRQRMRLAAGCEAMWTDP